MSRVKASAFYSWLNKLWLLKVQLGTSAAIWWVIEPHCMNTNLYPYLETSGVEAVDALQALFRAPWPLVQGQGQV
jgi:hypothetical protein